MLTMDVADSECIHAPKCIAALPTERPPCPKCRVRMELQRIDPGIRGFENRVFECGRCYTMKAVPAVIDRMKSASAKWAEAR